MKRNKNCIITLDIQDKYVSCAIIQHRSDHSWHIQKKVVKEILPLENAEEQSFNMATVQAIKSLLQKMEIYPPQKLATYINGRDAAVKILTLPNSEDQNMEKMIGYELTSSLPIKVEQMSYDYQIIERDEDSARVLAVAAKNSVLHRHLELLSLADVYPDVVTASSMMVFNAFREKEPEAIRDGRIGILCLRNSSGDVVISENGNLNYTRSFAFHAGDKEQLLREIHNSFGVSREDSHLQRIHIMTDNGELPYGLTHDDLSRAAPEAPMTFHGAGDYLSIGLAMADRSITHRSKPLKFLQINLIKQVIQEKLAAKRKASKAKLIYMAPTIAAAILLIISGIFWWQVYQATVKLNIIENERQVNKQQLENISELMEMEGILQTQIAALSWATNDRPMVSYMLYKIASIIPEEIRLKEVYIPEIQMSKKKKRNGENILPGLYIVGYANEQDDIGDFLNNLRACDCFSSVKQENTQEVRVNGQRVLEFTLELVYAGDINL